MLSVPVCLDRGVKGGVFGIQGEAGPVPPRRLPHLPGPDRLCPWHQPYRVLPYRPEDGDPRPPTSPSSPSQETRPRRPSPLLLLPPPSGLGGRRGRLFFNGRRRGSLFHQVGIWIHVLALGFSPEP